MVCVRAIKYGLQDEISKGHLELSTTAHNAHTVGEVCELDGFTSYSQIWRSLRKTTRNASFLIRCEPSGRSTTQHESNIERAHVWRCSNPTSRQHAENLQGGVGRTECYAPHQPHDAESGEVGHQMLGLETTRSSGRFCLTTHP